MTTQSWSTRIRHDSDATWQEWRDELITRLNALVAGGVLTADETNITPAAGARPGVNTEGGYAVYHLNDSLHATAPIYIRFGFGTGSGATTPRLQVTVGTTTNGSGVIGGIASTIASISVGSPQTTDSARQSFMCSVAGFFGLDWKIGSEAGSFYVCRTVDAAGAPTAIGALAHWGIGNSTTLQKRQCFRYASPAAAGTAQTTITAAMLGYAPFFPTTSAFGGDIQVYVAWAAVPIMAPVAGVCGVFAGELSNGTTFSAAVVGTTARTYLVMGSQSGPFGPTSGSGQLNAAMLWE